MPVQIMQIRCTAAYNPLFLTSRRDVPADSVSAALASLRALLGSESDARSDAPCVATASLSLWLALSRASRLYKVLWVAEKGVNGGWGLEPHALTSSISLTLVLGKLL